MNRQVLAVKTLDPTKKALWVAALRSGEYEQGRGNLHDKGKFCCLGVWLKVVEGILPSVGDHVVNNDLYRQMEKEGIDTPTCANMNDFDHLSFPQIADWIEENL